VTAWEGALDALRRAGYAAWYRPPGGVVKDPEGRYRAARPAIDDYLRRILTPEQASAALLAWLDAQPDQAVMLWPAMRTRRSVYAEIAAELVKAGLTVEELTGYAVRQVFELCEGANPADVAQAYAAVHNSAGAGRGPGVKIAYTAVRDVYR
jgi:hypothetical protein